jgi:ABC-2 type transport system ATP-binding protein
VTAVIACENLTKDFGSLRAVNGLTLAIEKSEIFGFLGPNGAGKTTTIRMFLDFLRPSIGTVSLLGGSGADPAIRRRIGYLPADLKIDRRYTGKDLLTYFSRIRAMNSMARARELCEMFELDINRPSGELSTGNRRKIGIVQAFMHRPELLILDEPTTGLDPILQARFIDLVRQSAAAGATVFLSSHMLQEVEALAGRVGIIRNGSLVTVSTIESLRQQARQHIELTLAGPADLSVFHGVPGLISAEAHGNHVRLLVAGPVDSVLKAAARLNVVRIATPGDDLTEIFMEFYQGDGR